jgi:stage II sporulation protein M
MPLNLTIPGPRKFLRYAYDIRAYLLAAVLIFMAFYLLGYLSATISPGATGSVMSGVQDEVSPMKDLTPIGLMLGIFENNVLKTFLVVMLGLGFGIVPAIFTLSNGLVLGIVTGMTAAKFGLIYVAAGVIPHGVVELPMVLLSSAIGMKLGTSLLLKLLRRQVNLTGDVKDALLIYFCWILPLLFLAAFLETFVTGPLLYYMTVAH